MEVREWPENKKNAVLISFDVDGEALHVVQGRDYVQITRGIYGVKRGLIRILELLRRLNIKATFFVCGFVIERHNDMVREIMNEGHELGFHGYIHEDYSKLSPDEIDIYIKFGIRVFEELLNVKPMGFRAPYWRIPEWMVFAIKLYGFFWDSSLMDNDTAYVIETKEGPLIEVPVWHVLDDWVLFEDHQKNYNEVLRTWYYEYLASLEEEGVYTLTLHPQVIGRGYRLKVLEKLLIRILKTRKSWIAKGVDIARWTLDLWIEKKKDSSKTL